MIANLLKSFHRALIAATLVFASVYVVLALWQGGASRADAEHLNQMMQQSLAGTVDDAGATLGWGDLLRHGERRDGEGVSLVGRMEGKTVRMAGYMVPLDGAAYRTTEFLLVPYYGACIHVPPPPPHQIVHGKAVPAEGFPLEIQKPVWVEGVFSLLPKQSMYGEASFSMEVRDVQVFQQ
ncbi:MAG: DUF3299 domain-containing protein [Bryobacterales bacterium]|jgi:hypothetical protein|nr:DUF3299 domain-containing protein [Bryobacterales bacterium]